MLHPQIDANAETKPQRKRKRRDVAPTEQLLIRACTRLRLATPRRRRGRAALLLFRNRCGDFLPSGEVLPVKDVLDIEYALAPTIGDRNSVMQQLQR
jgi:hypothetical protein